VNNNSNDEGGWSALEKWRKEIDAVDSEILSLLYQRQNTAAAIGKTKKELGLEIFDPDREKAVLEKLSSNNREYLSKDMIRNIFNEIISASRSIQEPHTVAFLGPEATFSHQAVLSLFGRSTPTRAAETIEDVFGMVEKGICRHGVVPIENSYEGSVNSTLDLLYKYELKIRAEVFLRIRHHLLSKGDSINRIKHLYSHSMPIAQCRVWIRNNMPGIPVKEVSSTSLAGRMAAGDPGSAAVGSRLCARTYGLKMIEENIEDHPDNVTRFLVIGKIDTEPTGKDKTSILFFLNHKPGALHRALGAFAKRDINMNRIESRPMKIRNWEYLFFVDFEGHFQEDNVNEAIREMEGCCAFMKLLGSYPAGSDPWD